MPLTQTVSKYSRRPGWIRPPPIVERRWSSRAVSLRSRIPGLTLIVLGSLAPCACYIYVLCPVFRTSTYSWTTPNISVGSSFLCDLPVQHQSPKLCEFIFFSNTPLWPWGEALEALLEFCRITLPTWNLNSPFHVILWLTLPKGELNVSECTTCILRSSDIFAALTYLDGSDLSVYSLPAPRLAVRQIHLFDFDPWCFDIQRYNIKSSAPHTSFWVTINGLVFSHRTSNGQLDGDWGLKNSLWPLPMLYKSACMWTWCRSTWGSPTDSKCRPAIFSRHY
jgi:hypothetical protein